MPRTYDEIFGDEPPERWDQNGHSVNGKTEVADTVPLGPKNLNQMRSELAALRRAKRAMDNQRKLLEKDGFPPDEIREILEAYEESWATGFVKQRAKKAGLYPVTPEIVTGERYTFGSDGQQTWVYDCDGGVVKPLFPVGWRASYAQRICEYANAGEALDDAITHALQTLDPDLTANRLPEPIHTKRRR